jgi:hypothetical protein
LSHPAQFDSQIFPARTPAPPDQGWKAEIEAQFVDISEARNLPLGCACVCFRDTSFPVFPTFPVMHRWHLDTFGRLFPPQLVNQHGDPFLFELYRRWLGPATRGLQWFSAMGQSST